MLGQLADFFRLWWALFYWNSRKTWFQVRRGRSPCPCQSPSDSGRAYETHCEACVSWTRPARFRRVCPLLVQTKDGLRCSANTPEVRPFWLRAFGWYGGAGLAIYLVAVATVFTVLRTVGYPVSVVHLALPPLWHRVTELRGWFFLQRANEAFARGNAPEGLLYLTNAYEFDPKNYTTGITLAKNLQASQPARSDRVFEQLMREHPERRAATAQDWFRALLARGSFEQVAKLARDQLLDGPAHGGVWLRALLVAVQHTNNDAPLRDLLASNSPLAAPWHRVVECELLLRAGRKAEARVALEQPWSEGAPAFTLYYRIHALIDLGESLRALDLLEKHRTRLDDEAAVTLQLAAYASSGSRLLHQTVNTLLSQRLNAPTVKIVCAHLIRFPDQTGFEKLWQKLGRDSLPLNSETAGAWFSLLCAAGAVGDRERLAELTAKLKHASSTPFLALSVVEAFFKGETSERRITAFLPILPLPLDVTYALIAKYSSGAGPAVAVPTARRP